MISRMISSLVQYGVEKELISAADAVYVRNQLLSVMQEDSYTDAEPEDLPLAEILAALCGAAVQKGIYDDSVNQIIFHQWI